MNFIYAFIIIFAVITGLALFSALAENAYVCEAFDVIKRHTSGVLRVLLAVIMLPAYAVWSLSSKLFS